MKNIEIATYITFTLLAIVVALILSARLAGPHAPFPTRPDEPPRKASLAAFSFAAGGAVMLIQIRALITIFEYKIPAIPNYLEASNRLFFVVVCLAASGFLMLDIFLSPTRWQLVLLGAGSGIALVLLTIVLEFTPLEDIEFLEVIAGISITIGIGIGLVHWFGVKRMRSTRGKWLQPAYIAPQWCARVLTSRLSIILLFVVVGVSTYLAWADLPIL